jgi:hypothetical protein
MIRTRRDGYGCVSHANDPAVPPSTSIMQSAVDGASLSDE